MDRWTDLSRPQYLLQVPLNGYKIDKALINIKSILKMMVVGQEFFSMGEKVWCSDYN